jgi:hypothetical protein
LDAGNLALFIREISLQNVSIITQLPGGEIVDNGIDEPKSCVIGASDAIALMVLAQSNLGIDQNAAQKAVEILLDDMQVNLSNPAGIDAAACLRESINNVNEYLYNRYLSGHYTLWDVATSVTAIQVWEGKIHCLVMQNTDCVLLHSGEIVELSQVEVNSGLLGVNAKYGFHISEYPVLPGDIIMLARSSDIDRIGHDYLRMTLRRFPQNMEMSLRQINQKAIHIGLKQPPGIILATINKSNTKMSGWIDKLRNR